MATQLSELYVQISAKGMAEAQAEIRKLRNELAASKKPAEDMENSLGRINREGVTAAGALRGLGAVMGSLGLGGLAPIIALVGQLIAAQRAAKAAAAALVLVAVAAKIPVLPPPAATPPIVRQVPNVRAALGSGQLALSQSTAMALYDPAFAASQLRKAPPPILPPAKPPVLSPAAGGLGMSAAAMGVIAAAVVVVGVAVSHVMGMFDAMKGKVMSLARAGFEGTVQLYQYEYAMKLIGREVAGALVPALNLLTSILMSVQRAIASVGPVGQKVFAAMLVGALALGAGITVLTGAVTVLVAALVVLWAVGWPIGVVVLAIAVAALELVAAFALVAGAIYLAWTNSKEFRNAVLGLKQQFLELLVTLEPVGVLLLKVGAVLLQAFVVEPLIRFISALTLALAILERMAKVSGLLKLFPNAAAGGGSKSSVTLNQTGEESGAQTFQRIQQEILKMGATDKTPEEKQTNALENIEKWLIDRFGKAPPGNAPDAPPAESIVGGAADWGAFGIGGMIASRLIGGR